jgi:hypothetical protein
VIQFSAVQGRNFIITALFALWTAIVCHDGSFEMVMASLLAATFLGVLWVRMFQGRVFWLEPGIVIGILFTLQFANGAVYAHYFPERVAVRGGLENRLVPAIELLLIGAFALLAGYATPFGRGLARRSPQFRREVTPARAVWAWVAAMTFCWGIRGCYELGLISTNTSSSYRHLPQLLLPIGALLAAALFDAGRRGQMTTYVIMAFVAEVLYQLGTAMKGNLLLPLAFSAVAVYVVRQRLPRLLVIAAALAFAVWIPVGLSLRFVLGNTPDLSTSAAVIEAFKDVSGRPVSETATETFAYLLHRTQMMDVFDAVITNVPEVEPFQYGRTYADIPLMLVPRAIWPSKPVFNYMKGEWGRYIAGVTPETEAVGMGMVAEFYFNFGTTGVIVGMFLLGVLLRALWHWFAERNERSIPAAMLFLTIIKQLTAVGAVASAFVGLVQLLLLFYVFYLAITVSRFRLRAPRPEYAV